MAHASPPNQQLSTHIGARWNDVPNLISDLAAIDDRGRLRWPLGHPNAEDRPAAHRRYHELDPT